MLFAPLSASAEHYFSFSLFLHFFRSGAIYSVMVTLHSARQFNLISVDAVFILKSSECLLHPQPLFTVPSLFAAPSLNSFAPVTAGNHTRVIINFPLVWKHFFRRKAFSNSFCLLVLGSSACSNDAEQGNGSRIHPHENQSSLRSLDARIHARIPGNFLRSILQALD